jgi:hypothetical protein
MARKGGRGAGKETRNLLDVVVVVDAGDVLQGLVLCGLRRPRRLSRVGRWFTGCHMDERVDNKGNGDLQATAGQYALWG